MVFYMFDENNVCEVLELGIIWPLRNPLPSQIMVGALSGNEATESLIRLSRPCSPLKCRLNVIRSKSRDSFPSLLS